MLAEQVDRRDEGLGLEREKPGRAGEVVAVGLGVDLDRVALHLGVEHVAAAAEVHDVENVDVLAQLLLGEVEALAELGDVELAGVPRGIDEDPGQGYQAGEALGADRRLAPAVLLDVLLHGGGTATTGGSR